MVLRGGLSAGGLLLGSFVVCVFWCEWIGVYDYVCACLMLLLCLCVGL